MAEYSILVVEDEQTLRRLLEYRLKKSYAVRTAANGEEALDRIGEEIPDLIISDIMMPKMDGFALQAALHQHSNTRAIPFIFLTAKADEQSRLRGQRTGVDDYITKPFDIDQLLSRIERLLERTRLFQTQLDARIGHDFSQKLMPKRMPRAEGYSTFFANRPLEHGGGDLFDWVEYEPGLFLITIGDVMGKGLQAKFYAFSFLSYVRGTLHSMLRTTRSPAQLMKRVNQVLMQDVVMEDTFASLMLIQWEPARNQITYTNAGHCRPILIRPEGAHVISHSEIILGLDQHAEFTDTTIDIPAGGALVLYTDGVMEQRKANGDMVGEEGILRASETAWSSDDPVQTMLMNILEASGASDFEDDILAFWLQREGGAA
jgi:phosphoserine phosphatase RsbU/P